MCMSPECTAPKARMLCTFLCFPFICKLLCVVVFFLISRIEKVKQRPLVDWILHIDQVFPAEDRGSRYAVFAFPVVFRVTLGAKF